MRARKSLALQAYFIQNKCPNWECRIRKKKLRCKGFVKPTEISPIYTVVIEYELKAPPRLKVVNPKLKLNANGEKPPHLYKGGFLCVYHPRKDEWDESKVLALTIIPWISLWIYFYEIWLSTGKWFGGGEHPIKNNN